MSKRSPGRRAAPHTSPREITHRLALSLPAALGSGELSRRRAVDKLAHKQVGEQSPLHKQSASIAMLACFCTMPIGRMFMERSHALGADLTRPPLVGSSDGSDRIGSDQPAAASVCALTTMPQNGSATRTNFITASLPSAHRSQVQFTTRRSQIAWTRAPRAHAGTLPSAAPRKGPPDSPLSPRPVYCLLFTVSARRRRQARTPRRRRIGRT